MIDDEAFIELANTLHIHAPDRVTDHLDESATRVRLADRWQLTAPLDQKETDDLRRTREVVRDAISDVAAGRLMALTTLQKLNQMLSASQRGWQLSQPSESAFVLIEVQTPAASMQVALSLARFLSEHDCRRLKMCENPDCRWVFIDASRNRSRRWCASGSCGTLSRVRAFRAKKQSR